MADTTILTESTRRLELLLKNADQEDLDVLSNYNFGETREASAEELVRAIRQNGSHDVRRWVWGEAEYLEIVRHVAERFGLAWEEGDDESALEQRLLVEILRQSWTKMSEAEQQAVHDLLESDGIDKDRLSEALVGGTVREFLPTLGYLVLWNITRLVAAAAAREAGLLAGEVLLGGVAAQLLGPLGILAGVIIFLSDLAGPAYRKLIPTVIQIAYIRSKAAKRLQG